MVNLNVHRKMSFVNDRGFLYVYVDNVNKGKVTVLRDKEIEITRGRHEVFIKDIFGFKSKKYTFETNGNESINLNVSNNYILVISLLILVILSILLKAYPKILGLSFLNGISYSVFLAVVAIVILILFFLNRNRLYSISEK